MKILMTLFISLTTAISMYAQSTQTITVTVPNASSDAGTMYFELDNKDTFLIKSGVKTAKSNIENGTCTITFTEVPAGEYAITCFHDKNDNGKMDFQPNGMPIEAYGASNNVMNFGPPQYNDAKFSISDKDVSLTIKL